MMNYGKQIDFDFFLRNDVVEIARELIGKRIITRFDGVSTGGIITETEAYAGETDRASHAYGGRLTARTEVMYQEGGTLYVYLCYGIHSLVNIVTNRKGIPHAVLLRAFFPLTGKETMQERRGKFKGKLADIGMGPGNFSKALGISLQQNRTLINNENLMIFGNKLEIPEKRILCGPRIGVDYAGKDAMLPYRFYVKHSDLMTLIQTHQ